jgi:excisionase family DNA binding protein
MTRQAAPLVLTVAEAARALGVGRSTAYRAIAAGELHAVRIRSCVRVPVASIAAFLARNEATS